MRPVSPRRHGCTWLRLAEVDACAHGAVRLLDLQPGQQVWRGCPAPQTVSKAGSWRLWPARGGCTAVHIQCLPAGTSRGAGGLPPAVPRRRERPGHCAGASLSGAGPPSGEAARGARAAGADGCHTQGFSVTAGTRIGCSVLAAAWTVQQLYLMGKLSHGCAAALWEPQRQTLKAAAGTVAS